MIRDRLLAVLPVACAVALSVCACRPAPAEPTVAWAAPAPRLEPTYAGAVIPWRSSVESVQRGRRLPLLRRVDRSARANVMFVLRDPQGWLAHALFLRGPSTARLVLIARESETLSSPDAHRYLQTLRERLGPPQHVGAIRDRDGQTETQLEWLHRQTELLVRIRRSPNGALSISERYRPATWLENWWHCAW